MGLFDSFKKAFGGGSAPAETVKGPSQVLRENGIDPSRLDVTINPDGTLSVSGRLDSQEECDKACQALEDMPNVKGVQNNIAVGPEPAPEPEPEPEPTPAPAPEAVTEPEAVPEPAPEVAGTEAVPEADEVGGRTHTVVPGDSLWKIAESAYGNGADYMKIFEANRDQLDNPDLIKPGQVLKIPE